MDADRLMALLYGELDEGEARRERARMSEDPAAASQLVGLEHVREMFRGLPDEEPPARISAQLLAEAARSVPAQRRAAAAEPEAGWWARLVSWLSPMVHHPGLAAAATLVLVAGVAGVLYLRKGEDLGKAGRKADAPAAQGAAGAPGGADERTTLAPEAPAEAGAEVQADKDDGAEHGTAIGSASALDRAPDPAPEAKMATRAKPKDVPAAASRGRTMAKGAAGAKSEYAAPPPARKSDNVKSGTVYGLSEQEMTPGDSAGAGDSTGGEAAPPAPSPAPPPPPTGSAPTTKARPPTAAELHARAVDAALDKRCSDVRSLAAEIRAINIEYYKSKFAGDRRLQKCLESPTQYPARK